MLSTAVSIVGNVLKTWFEFIPFSNGANRLGSNVSVCAIPPAIHSRMTVSAVGSTFDGTVSQITPTATSTSGGSSVVTYAVRITLTNAPAAVLAGMTASLAVTTAQVANVIAVPAIALVGSAGFYGVRVIAADGTSQVVPVDVGLVTTSLAEIKTGLTEGETVSIGTVSARTTNTTTGGGGIPGVPGGGGGGGGGFNRGGGD